MSEHDPIIEGPFTTFDSTGAMKVAALIEKGYTVVTYGTQMGWCFVAHRPGTWTAPPQLDEALNLLAEVTVEEGHTTADCEVVRSLLGGQGNCARHDLSTVLSNEDVCIYGKIRRFLDRMTEMEEPG
jgi:hypothetical protein